LICPVNEMIDKLCG